MRNYLYLFFLVIVSFSCTELSTPSIIKIETEYNSNCVYKDSCIKFIRTEYSNGWKDNDFYLKYPHMHTLTLFDSTGKLISELQKFNEISILNTMTYNENGDEIKYTRNHLTKPGPELVYNYENRYDKADRLIEQRELNLNGTLKNTKTFYYDSLNYSMIIVKQKGNRDTTLISYYKGEHLTFEYRFAGIKNNRELKYNNDGKLIFEDIRNSPQLRRFYFYKDGRITKTIDKYRNWNGKSFVLIIPNQIHEVTEYKYYLDAEDRPIKTIKSTSRDDKIMEETITITEYF